MISIDALDVTDLATNGLLFEFRSGHPSELAEWIGADDDVPEAEGMDPGAWRRRSRLVRLFGVVIGAGSTVAAQQSSFRTRMTALRDVLDVNSLVTIETTGEFGMASATLSNCRPQRLVPEFEFADLVWHGYIELICIDSPPEWEPGS